MAIIAAVNYNAKRVLLEDGREMAIGHFYMSLPDEPRLTAQSELREDQRIDDWEIAEVFTVPFPSGDALIIELNAVQLATAREIN